MSSTKTVFDNVPQSLESANNDSVFCPDGDGLL